METMFMKLLLTKKTSYFIIFDQSFLTHDSLLNRSLLDKKIDVMLYVDRLDEYRVDNLDRQVIRAIARSFGQQIWKIAILALTHAQLSPPDGINYDEFVMRRSAALLEMIHREAGLNKGDLQVLCCTKRTLVWHNLFLILGCSYHYVHAV
jgi:hypothetical protein